MPELTLPSPLMQLVLWQGHDYFTGQYFHRQYLNNSPHGGKYRRQDNFMRAIRNIPAYKLFVENLAIVEINWSAVKQEQPQLCGYFKPLFYAAGWQTITLLNATAQAELAHHLDDEASQQQSLTASTMVARQRIGRVSQPLPMEAAVRELEAGLYAARLLGTPLHIAQQEIVKMIEGGATGISFRGLLLAAPAQTNIAPDDKMLEPTELAKTFGLPSAIALNRHLHTLGWQVQRIGGGWEPTPTGAPHAAQHAWIQGAKSGYNLVWRIEAVRQALLTAGVLPGTQEQAHA